MTKITPKDTCNLLNKVAMQKNYTQTWYKIKRGNLNPLESLKKKKKTFSNKLLFRIYIAILNLSDQMICTKQSSFQELESSSHQIVTLYTQIFPTQTKARSGWKTVHSLGSLKFTFALNQIILQLLNNTNDDTWWRFYEWQNKEHNTLLLKVCGHNIFKSLILTKADQKTILNNCFPFLYY